MRLVSHQSVLTMLSVVTLISACAVVEPPRPVEIMVAFNESQARALMAPGVNTVKGNAFMRQRGGGVVTCAGADVRLVPGTDYASERMFWLYGNREKGVLTRISRPVSPPPQPFEQLTHKTVCDSQGNFTFESVSDGEFFVVTSVRWQVGNSNEGGFLMQRVVLKGGQTTSVILSA